MNFRQPLFVAMLQDLWEILQMFVDLLEGFGIISRNQHFFPQILGRMGPFDGFHTKIDFSVFFSKRRIQGIGQRTTGSITKARDGIGMLTKGGLVGFGLANNGFVGTKLVIDHLPYHIIVLHDATGGGGGLLGIRYI
jgi:hypothetical protein